MKSLFIIVLFVFSLLTVPRLAIGAVTAEFQKILGLYSPEFKILNKTISDETRLCQISKVTIEGKDPVPDATKPFKVTFFLYEPREKVQDKRVIIAPPTGGITILDRGYANRFCKHGVTVGLLDSWDGIVEFDLSFSLHDRYNFRGPSAIRLISEYFGKPSGLIGSSIGAIHGSIAMALDPRIKTAALIAGGGNLKDILITSTHGATKDIRDQRIQKWNIKSEADYNDLLNKNVYVDNLALAQGGGKKDLLFVILTEDTMVPTKTQFALWEAWGKPEKIERSNAHVNGIILSYLFNGDRIYDFVMSHL